MKDPDILNMVEDVLDALKRKELVISKWKDKKYFRKYKKPKNPRTRKQQGNRNKFKRAVGEWKKLSEKEKENYKELAEELHMTGFNLFISKYLNEN
jgi:wobble nucleotide-excising tRNase